jgi:hypothetical protein
MSAISQRIKRATAGKRMANLVGKAVEDDEAFWNHDTWADEGDDDGNDSFHESDEDSEVRKDHFDSDFDDSESDNEAEDVAAGEAEEKRLRQEEKASRRTALDGVARAGRELLQKKRGRIKGNRIFGDGFNAGLVLNFPPNYEKGRIAADAPRSATESAVAEMAKVIPSTLKVPPVATTAVAVEVPSVSPSQEVAASVEVKETEPIIAAPMRSSSARTAPVRSVAAVPAAQGSAKAAATKVTLASTRARRGKKHLRTSTQESSKTSATNIAKGGKATRSTVASATVTTTSTKRSKRQLFSQEELLLEAATITEPENGRWLLGRKRLYQQTEAARNAQNHQQGSSKLLQRYVSKRGCFNTLNFFEMDAVPKILVPNTSESAKPKPVQPTLCAISGKRARYKDPKTQLGYYDLAAYRELQRRHDAGETLVVKSAPVATTSAVHPPTKKAKTQASPKIVTKTVEVPSLQPEAAEPAKVPPTAASSDVNPAAIPVVVPPPTTSASATATAAAGARAQKTVQDPDRKLTMTTRNASKHASPEKPKPIVAATKSKLIAPIPAFSGAPTTGGSTTKVIPKAAKASSKRSTESATVPSDTATKKARVSSPKAVASTPAATSVLPASTANPAAATTPKSAVRIVAESTPKDVAKPVEETNGGMTPALTLSEVAKTGANETAAVGKPIVVPSPAANNDTAVTAIVKPVAATPAKKKATKAPAKRKRAATTTKAPPLTDPDPVVAKPSAASTTKAQSKKMPGAATAKATGSTAATANPSVAKRQPSSLRMSPNTLVHSALAAYLKQQEEEKTK